MIYCFLEELWEVTPLPAAHADFTTSLSQYVFFSSIFDITLFDTQHKTYIALPIILIQN